MNLKRLNNESCFSKIFRNGSGGYDRIFGWGGISKQVLKNEAGNITLFSFDRGEGLSEHTAPFDALVQILDGEAEVTLGGKELRLLKGEAVIMPAGVRHALHAAERFKMLLTMIRR